MTDAMLRLARAVYPDRAIIWNAPDLILMWPQSMVTDGVSGLLDFTPGEVFDPANNADQFCDVLAWLTRQTCIDWHKPDCNAIGGEHQIVLCDYDGETFDHDGTASGIRRAVVEAAMRVAK